MEEYTKQIAELENLRKRVRVSYGVYGLVLLAGLIMAFVANLTWTLCIGLLGLVFYFAVSRQDIQKYKDQFQKIKFRQELGKVFPNLEIVKNSLFTPQIFASDALAPAEADKGIVRIGVKGESASGLKMQLADVAFPINLALGRGNKRCEILAGCYLRLTKEAPGTSDSPLFVLFRKTHKLAFPLKKHYEQLGLKGEEWREYYVFSPTGQGTATDVFNSLAADIPNIIYGNDILLLGEKRLRMLMASRFLNVGSLSYNKPITAKSFDYLLLPQLPQVMDLAKEYFK